MGTVFSIELRGAEGQVDATDAVGDVVEWLHWVDRTFSTYKGDSQICRLDRGELTLDECHPHVQAVLDQAEALRGATGGYFDVRASGGLDPSGLVKGWSIEVASARLAGSGWPHHLVDGGGDVRLRRHPGADHPQPWRVALRHPFDLGSCCAVLEMAEGAVATSGTYERGFHVMDPHRGRAVTDTVALTVVGPDLAVADAYATAGLAMGLDAPDWLGELDGYEAYLVDAGGGAWETPGFDRLRAGA